MKKLVLLMIVSSAMLFACGGPSEAEKEKQDSISASNEADSLLKAQLAEDSLKNSTGDTIKAK